MSIMTVFLSHCKQFLYETPVASLVDDTVQDLVAVWNLQIQVCPPRVQMIIALGLNFFFSDPSAL
jgi:hypothetical protein